MFQRNALAQIASALRCSPAVAVLGPRQVGKTTLAKQLAAMGQPESIYLYLQDERDRRKGHFLLLGSASFSLLRQGAESLAGRLATVELGGLLALEIEPTFARQQQLWLRGGFPESFAGH
jgi:uncharacterized protein